MTRILAIEPSPERGALLGRLVREAVDAEVMPVTTTKEALAAIEAHQPDVILTSSILPPQDDRELVSHLRQTPALRHLPILIVPPVMEPPHVDTTLLARLRLRRQPSFWLAYDFDAVVSRIEDAIEDSRWTASRAQRMDAPEERRAPESALAEFAPQAAVAIVARPHRLKLMRERARRWEGWQLSWLSCVRFPSGFELRAINVSASGILLESDVRIPLGTTTSFDLWGPNRTINVSGRIIRSDIGVVSFSGVRYHAAAVFDHAIDTLIPAEAPIEVETQPGHVVDTVLDRATLVGTESPELPTGFEAGVAVRDIGRRDTQSSSDATITDLLEALALFSSESASSPE